MRAVWHGTVEEAQTLCEIVSRHCACSPPPSDSAAACGAHALMLDQRALNGLLFVRHMVVRLLQQELDATVAHADADGPSGRSAVNAS